MYMEPQDPSLPPLPQVTDYPHYRFDAEVQTIPQAIPEDPSLPPVPQLTDWYPGYYCDCLQPIPEERAERRGAARTYCARCDRELPLRLGAA